MKIEDESELPSAEMGVSDTLKEGQWCLATGHPGGYQIDRKPVLRLGRVLLLDNDVLPPTARSSAAIPAARCSTWKGKVIGINSRIAHRLTPTCTCRSTRSKNLGPDDEGRSLGAPARERAVHRRPGRARGDGSENRHRPARFARREAGLLTGDIVSNDRRRGAHRFCLASANIRDRQPGETVKLVVKRGEKPRRSSQAAKEGLVASMNVDRWT